LVELFKMLVGMAINTSGVDSRKLLFQTIFTLRKMAASACNLQVLTLQGVIGLVVVEHYFVPGHHRMAAITFVVGQVFIRQHIFMKIIVTLGTLITSKGKVPPGIHFMTSKTGRCQVGPLQREFRLSMLFDGKT